MAPSCWRSGDHIHAIQFDSPNISTISPNSQTDITLNLSVMLLSTGLAMAKAETLAVLLAKDLKERGVTVRTISIMTPRAFELDLRRTRIRVDSFGVRVKKLPFLFALRSQLIPSYKRAAVKTQRTSSLRTPMSMLSNRVLFLATGLNCGGAETQVVHLAKGLLARGWQVEVTSLLRDGALGELLREAGIPVHELGMRRAKPNPRAILRLRKIILAFHPDIVHSHMVHANLLTRVTRLVCPMPALVTTAHSMIEGGRRTEIAYRLTDCLGDLTTTVSRAAAERHVRVGSVPEKRLKVVVNGLPLDQFRPDPQIRAAVRQQLGVQDEFVWLAVGRFEAPKDYPNLINAISRVSSQRDLFLIAGDGPLRSEIETLAAVANISHRIRFLGIRKDISDLMAAADGYVMSSAWEGLPMVLLEAAGSSLPIVTTNVGGNCEIVCDGISGFLVPPSDATALSDALLRMERQSPLARAAMGSSGREFVIEHYSLSSVLDQWEFIYRSLMKNSSQLAYAQRGAS